MEHESADISVVIPYYNREQYIDEAVQSVLAQTLQPLEIILINDGSRESSRRYLDRYAEVCIILDLPVNMGIAAARNDGIRRARGRFIAFLDDDDIWEPTKLEVQARYMRDHPGCAAIHTAIRAFYANGSERIFDQKPSLLTLARALQQPGEVVPSSLLIRADVVRSLGGFDPRFRRSEDNDLTIRCAAAGYRIESIREPLTRLRRQGQASLMWSHWPVFLAQIGVFWKHKALYYRAYGVRGIVRYPLARLERWTDNVRYVGGAIRLLTRLLPVKWKVRPDYDEPVTPGA